MTGTTQQYKKQLSTQLRHNDHLTITHYFQICGIRPLDDLKQAGLGRHLRYQKANSELKMKIERRRNEYEELCPLNCLKRNDKRGKKHEVE